LDTGHLWSDFRDLNHVTSLEFAPVNAEKRIASPTAHHENLSLHAQNALEWRGAAVPSHSNNSSQAVAVFSVTDSTPD
jgi:hypothetical protein